MLLHGDCLVEMSKIADGSVDMILADLPYGTTGCKWDRVIPFEPLWAHYWRVLKPNGAVVLFGCQPFTSSLIMSQARRFKYSLVWKRSRVGFFAQAPYRFLSVFEDICVFSHGGCSKNAKIRMSFYPQGTESCHKVCDGKGHSEHRPSRKKQSKYVQRVTAYPKNILEFKSDSTPKHPTQKPVALLKYLIKTYTLEGETVLDNTMGSGSTGVACVNTGRKFIGIEMDDKYFAIAQERINKAKEARTSNVI